MRVRNNVFCTQCTVVNTSVHLLCHSEPCDERLCYDALALCDGPVCGLVYDL